MTNKTLEHYHKILDHSDRLSEKEKNILLLRLKGQTLLSIGGKYHNTAERIRQIEENALRRLLSKTYQKKLFPKMKRGHK